MIVVFFFFSQVPAGCKIKSDTDERPHCVSVIVSLEGPTRQHFWRVQVMKCLPPLQTHWNKRAPPRVNTKNKTHEGVAEYVRRVLPVSVTCVSIRWWSERERLALRTVTDTRLKALQGGCLARTHTAPPRRHTAQYRSRRCVCVPSTLAAATRRSPINVNGVTWYRNGGEKRHDSTRPSPALRLCRSATIVFFSPHFLLLLPSSSPLFFFSLPPFASKEGGELVCV